MSNAKVEDCQISDKKYVQRPNGEATVLSRTTTYGNIWMREVFFEKAGDIKLGHQHDFDHTHFLTHGSGEITIYDCEDDDKIILKKVFHAPALLKVPKEHRHQMIALEDGSRGYCLQAMMDSDGKPKETDYAVDEDFLFDVAEYQKDNK